MAGKLSVVKHPKEVYQKIRFKIFPRHMPDVPLYITTLKISYSTILPKRNDSNHLWLIFSGIEASLLESVIT